MSTWIIKTSDDEWFLPVLGQAIHDGLITVAIREPDDAQVIPIGGPMRGQLGMEGTQP